MNDVNIVELLIGLGATLMGFIMRRQYMRIDSNEDQIQELQRDNRLMEHKIMGHREHVAMSYVHKDEHAEFRTEVRDSFKEVSSKLDKISDKLDGKADK